MGSIGHGMAGCTTARPHGRVGVQARRSSCCRQCTAFQPVSGSVHSPPGAHPCARWRARRAGRATGQAALAGEPTQARGGSLTGGRVGAGHRFALTATRRTRSGRPCRSARSCAWTAAAGTAASACTSASCGALTRPPLHTAYPPRRCEHVYRAPPLPLHGKAAV
jgi:hypothetical protein